MCRVDATFKCLFEQLSDNDSILAFRLKTYLLNRIKDRRRNEISGILSYLQNTHNVNDYFDDNITDLFSIPSKMIISLTKRMKMSKESEQRDYNNELSSTSKSDSTLKEKLQLKIKIKYSMRTLSAETHKEDFSNMIKQEMNLFEARFTQRTNFLILINDSSNFHRARMRLFSV